MAECLFCKIVEKQIPTRAAYEDDEVLAFEDIEPQAPVHLLVIPKRHIATLNDLTPDDEQLMGTLFTTAARLARERGFADRGWRVAVNVNRDAHQLVFHVHVHLLAGRSFGWPPG